MSLEAVAVIHLPPAAVAAWPEADGKRTALDGRAYAVSAIDDALLVHTGVSLAALDADALAEQLHDMFGDALEAHEHERGVPIFPASYSPNATTFAGLVEELGEAAEWITIWDDADDEAADPFAALAGGMPDPAQLQAMLGGAGGGNLLEAAMQMAQQLAGTEAFQDLKDKAASGEAVDPSQALASMGIDAGGLDLSAMAAQAQQMLSQNPDLAAQLGAALGGEQPEEDDHED